MPANQNITIQEETDIKKLFDLVIRHYRIFVGTIIITLILAFAVNRFATPIFKISASMLIKEETQAQHRDVNDFINSSLFGLNHNFQNELWILKSSPVIAQTVKNLDLTVNYYQKDGIKNSDAYKKAPFQILLMLNHPQPVDVQFFIAFESNGGFIIKSKSRKVIIKNFNTNEIINYRKKWKFEHKGKFGQLIETPEMAFIIQPDTTNRHELQENEFIYSFSFSDPTTIVERLKKQLSFDIAEKEATVVEIGLKIPCIGKGKDIINELMNVYSQQNLDRKNHLANITIEYIDRQLSEISDSLSRTENNLQTFRSSHQLLDITEQASGISSQYMDLQNKMAELITRKRYYDYVSEYLSKNSDFSNMIVPASMGIQDPLLNGLMSELITAYTQRTSLIQNQQEKNPLVQRLTIQIENLLKTIKDNINAVQKTTEISIDEMQKRINKVEAQISHLPTTQRQLGGIERKYRLNDAIYNYLLEKRAEAKITQASNLPDNIIIEPATMEGTGPVFPNTRMNYLAALFLGFVIPFGLLLMKGIVNNKIDYSDNFEKITEMPLLGKILHNRHKSDNVMMEYPKSNIAESFRALRTNLEYHFRNITHKVILVTSSTEGEGKSFTALNIAMSYAQLGMKTLLVNFDLRKPAGYFSRQGGESMVGLSSYFSDSISLDDIILQSDHKMLHYIPAGPIPPNPVELISMGNTKELISQLKEMYDCIVLDTTPLAQVSDAYLLMDYADIKIVVARFQYTIKKVLTLISKDLKQKNISNLCLVINDNCYYRDQYGYGYGYYKKRD
jgi:capsular exopolysaccharide synthesis family protein